MALELDCRDRGLELPYQAWLVSRKDIFHFCTFFLFIPHLDLDNWILKFLLSKLKCPVFTTIKETEKNIFTF